MNIIVSLEGLMYLLISCKTHSIYDDTICRCFTPRDLPPRTSQTVNKHSVCCSDGVQNDGGLDGLWHLPVIQ